MSKASSTPGLFQRLLARPAPAMEQDAADYGTCIGLEFSLDQAEAAPLLPTPAPSRAPGWMRRLAARGRSTP